MIVLLSSGLVACAGSKGPQGAAGPQGPSGVQGPTGTQGRPGGGVDVVDGNGTLIGPALGVYPNGAFRILVFANGLAWPIDPDGSWTPNGLSFFYESTDCTGAPYTLGARAPQLAYLKTAPAKEGDPAFAIVTGAAPATHTFNSYFDTNMQVCSASVFQSPALPLEQAGTVPAKAQGPIALR